MVFNMECKECDYVYGDDEVVAQPAIMVTGDVDNADRINFLRCPICGSRQTIE